MVFGPIIAAFGFILFAAASFFCALAETALFTLSPWQARQLAERDPGRGAGVSRLLAAPQDLLATLVLGNTFANAALVGIGLWSVWRLGYPLVGTLAVVLLVILVGGEVIPKTLAVRAPDFWALRVARPLARFQALTRPLHRLAQRVDAPLLRGLARLPIGGPAGRPAKTAAGATEEDYAELLELAFQQGALGQTERDVILQVLDLDRRTAQEVMQPRARMHCLPDDASVEQMVAEARRLKHRRLPLYDGTPDTIVGVLNTRTLLLNPQVDLAEAIELPSFVPESINLMKLLKSLQRQQRGVAIVLDEFGGTAGLVTAEDILGAVVGRIRSEGEPEGFVMEKLGPRRWRVNGTMRLEDFRREYPELGEAPGVDTMGGLLVALAEVVPPEGQAVSFGGLRLTARSADERRVRELLVEAVR